MRTVIRRPARSRALLVLLATVGLALTACGSGPSQVNSAAIVGQKSIPLGDVQHDIQWIIDNSPTAQQAKEQGKLAQYTSNLVTFRVMNEITSIAAKRAGVGVSRGEIDELIQSSGGVQKMAKQSALPPNRLRDAVRSELLLRELGRKYLDELRVSFTLGAVAKEDADATAKERALELGRKMVAQPERADELSKKFSEPNVPSQIRGQLSPAESFRAQGRSLFDMSSLFSVPAGSAVAFQPSQEQSGWMVALVRERDTSANGSGDGEQQLVSALGQQNLQAALTQIGRRGLGPLAAELGVRINPRYGVWDQVSMQVVPGEEERTGYALTPDDVSATKP